MRKLKRQFGKARLRQNFRPFFVRGKADLGNDVRSQSRSRRRWRALPTNDCERFDRDSSRLKR